MGFNALQIGTATAMVALAGSAYAQQQAQEQQLKVGDKAPSIETLEFVKGKPVTGFEKGHVYVVEFWARWCGPCIRGFPHLSELQKKYQDDVTIIAVNIWDNRQKQPHAEYKQAVNDWVSNRDDMNYTVAVDTDDKLTASYMQAAQRRGIPSAFIVNGEGEISWIGHPMQMDAALEEAVKGGSQPEKMSLEQEMKKADQLASEGNVFEAEAAERPQLYIGDRAPNLQNTKHVSGDEFNGFSNNKATVVEFWATWCGPCIAGIPHLNDLTEKHDGEAQIVSVNIWDEQPDESADARMKRVSEWVENRGDMAYTVSVDTSKGLEDSYMAAAGQNGIPAAFVVNSEGIITWIGHPMQMDEALERTIAGKIDPKKEAEKQLNAQATQQVMQQMWVALQQGELADAYATGRAMVKNDKVDNHMFANAVAWQILTNEDLEVRDLKLAHELATLANKLTEGEDGSIMDTLAKAEFEMGNVAKAIELQRKALKNLPENMPEAQMQQMKKEMQERLAQYEKARTA